MREFSNFASLSLLTLLVFSIIFFLSGCGFLNQSLVARITTNPTASGGTVTVPTGETIHFDATNSSANGGEITDYEWNFKSNSGSTGETGSGKTVSYSYQNTGTYTVKLTVTDDSGKTDSATIEVEVVELTASFTVSDDSPITGDTVTFDASSSVGSIESYTWDLKHGITDPATATGEIVNYTYGNAGSYVVKLTTVDENGFSDSTKRTIDVSSQNNDPPASTIDADPKSGEPPLEVDLDASGSSDPDGTIASYEWDFGDGETGSGIQVTHTFNEAAESTKFYTVVLTVTDDDGAKATDEIDILTIIPPRPPG